jgi:hypothetical protein
MLAVIPCTTIPMLRFGPRRPFMAAAVPTNDLIDFPCAPVLRLIGWMNSVASQYPAEEWHNHLPGTPPTDQPANVTTFRPREEPAKEPVVAPEPIRHQWRHL